MPTSNSGQQPQTGWNLPPRPPQPQITHPVIQIPGFYDDTGLYHGPQTVTISATLQQPPLTPSNPRWSSQVYEQQRRMRFEETTEERRQATSRRQEMVSNLRSLEQEYADFVESLSTLRVRELGFHPSNFPQSLGEYISFKVEGAEARQRGLREELLDRAFAASRLARGVLPVQAFDGKTFSDGRGAVLGQESIFTPGYISAERNMWTQRWPSRAELRHEGIGMLQSTGRRCFPLVRCWSPEISASLSPQDIAQFVPRLMPLSGDESNFNRAMTAEDIYERPEEMSQEEGQHLLGEQLVAELDAAWSWDSVAAFRPRHVRGRRSSRSHSHGQTPTRR